MQGGGALFHGSENVDVELSTITGNMMKAVGTTPALQRSGGIESIASANSNYIGDTIAGNGLDPASQGAGITGLNFQAGGGTHAFSNTIIANPVGSAGSNCDGGPFPDNGTPNLEFPVDMSNPCFDLAHVNILRAAPQLGALGNNGGSTPTMLPAPTSPVIDQGTAADQNDPTEDQRGLTRPVVFTGLTKPFDGSDIGAVEVQATCAGQLTPGGTCPSPPPPPPPTTTTGQRAAAVKKCKKKFKGKAKAKKRKKCLKKANKQPV